MTNEEALKMAKHLRFAVISKSVSIPWMLAPNIVAVYNGGVMRDDEAVEFMKLLLNTFIDVHGPKPKSLNEEESSAAEKLRKMLAANAEEHCSHNFVQQWQEQHENDENNHLIDFGRTNKGTKKRTIKIDPAGETPIDDDPEESEEDIPQIIINIGELNINLNGGV